jgi:cell division protein FtsB
VRVVKTGIVEVFNWTCDNWKKSQSTQHGLLAKLTSLVALTFFAHFAVYGILQVDGLYFDEVSKVRVLDSQKAQETAELRDECKSFVDRKSNSVLSEARAQLKLYQV